MYQEIIVDIETLGTGKDTVVLSIGMVNFNLNDEDNYDTLEEDGRVFYAVLDAQDQIDNYRRTVTFDTMKFWIEQDRNAQRMVFNAKQFPVVDVLEAINRWVGKSEPNLWGNGATFDNVILRSLFEDYGVPFFTPFWNDMDLRTLKYLSGNSKPKIPRGIAHNALEDAKYEVLCAQHYARLLRGK